MTRYQAGEMLLVTLFAAGVVFQLFIPPSIGLANNGDFSKMIGRFSLGSATMDASEEYKYFATRWVYDRSYLWVANDRSSELIPVTAAVLIGWWFSSESFDIRILGAIHAVLWIGCFAAVLPLLRPLDSRRRYFAGLAAAFIFTDVSYIAYCNSCYTDTAAFLFLAWSLVLWLHFTNSQPRRRSLFVLFVAASSLCVASKSQHAPLAAFLFVLAVTAALLFEGRGRRAAALVFSLLILLAASVTFLRMPDSEKSPAEYAVIFMSILHNSPAPLDEARELGLGPEYLRYVDFWPQNESENPMANPQWREGFSGRTNYGRIGLFYLRHPWRTCAIVYRVLWERGETLRPGLGNYERAAGFPPGTETRTFGWWSALRSALLRLAPWHIAIWYAAILAIGAWFGIARPATAVSRIGIFAALLAGMGLVELGVSSLADAGETGRHLFLFHDITDFTIMLAIFAAAWIFQGKANLRARS